MLSEECNELTVVVVVGVAAVSTTPCVRPPPLLNFKLLRSPPATANIDSNQYHMETVAELRVVDNHNKLIHVKQ